jgi:putative phosphoserine phosphatase/1-acylglycerol-3-phosphate O-acyltransferase
VEDWTLDDLPERIEEVRQLYLDTLKNWPQGEVPVHEIYKKAPTKKAVKKAPVKKSAAKKAPAKKAAPAAKKTPNVKGRK